jgi:hypothetical protein
VCGPFLCAVAGFAERRIFLVVQAVVVWLILRIIKEVSVWKILKITLSVIMTLIVLIYASGVYFLWSNATSIVILNQKHLAVNSLLSPEDRFRGSFERMGCRDKECSCAVKEVFKTTSRAQRLLVGNEGNRWNMFLWQVPRELMVINSLHSLGLTNAEIDDMREQGKQKFAEALKACREQVQN